MNSTNFEVLGQRNPFLDLLRSFSIVWLIGYHSYWFLGLMLTPEQVSALFSTSFSRFLFLGHNGVDIFFVLSGFLICQSAFALRERYPDRWIRSFFIKRAFRILPALVFVVMLAALINLVVPLAKNLQNVWANLLMVNNYLPVKDQALGWTWSLAIEEQFYLVFPFLLTIFSVRPKFFLNFCSVVLICSIIIKHFVFVGAGPWPSEIPFHPTLTPAEFVQYFDSVYSKTHVRFGPIVVGVMCFLLLSRNSFAQIAKAPRLFYLVAMAVTVLPLLTQQIYFETIFQKTLFALGIAMLIACNQIVPLAGLKTISSWMLWNKLARWSYAAFLINPFVILILAMSFLSKGLMDSVPLFVVYCLLCQIVSFAIAALIFKWIESPMNKWGRKIVDTKRD